MGSRLFLIGHLHASPQALCDAIIKAERAIRARESKEEKTKALNKSEKSDEVENDENTGEESGGHSESECENEHCIIIDME